MPSRSPSNKSLASCCAVYLQPRLDEGKLGGLPANETGRRIVVVVDEHVETRAILHHALTAAGYSVELAPDGLTGLKMTCRIHPALIIMEHPAYVYGGRALIESVQANVEMEDVAIMIVSSRGGRNDQWLERHPCDAYLSKPFQIDELLNVVSVLTGPEASADSTDSPAFSLRSARNRRLGLQIPRPSSAPPPADPEVAATLPLLEGPPADPEGAATGPLMDGPPADPEVAATLPLMEMPRAE